MKFIYRSRLGRRVVIARHFHTNATGIVLLTITLVLLATATRAAAPTPGNDSSDAPRSRLGLTLGSPQTLALTYEYAISSPFQLQVNAGTVVVYSAFSGRILVVPDTWRVQPYAFAGGGALHGTGYESMDGEGWTGFTWGGAGLRLRIGWLLLFGELGRIANLNESKDFEPSYSSGAVGFLVQF